MIHPNVQMARSNQDAMLQILQMLVADREIERAERQDNLTTLQQIARWPTTTTMVLENRNTMETNSRTFKTPTHLCSPDQKNP